MCQPVSTSSTEPSPFLQACRGQQPNVPPVWFMRQAGRSLPEYHKARQNVPMLEACATPELVSEITMQPVRRYDVDAAIVYSDIVVPLRWAGVDVDIVPGVGPVVAEPIRTLDDVHRLPTLHHDQVAPLHQAITMLVAELGPKPLIGFAGAPFTLASYLVEGGPSKNHEHTKAMMLGAPDVWNALLTKLGDVSAVFLEAQIGAGAQAIQLFDSWAGALPATTYRSLVLPHTRQVFSRVRAAGGPDLPLIHFGVGTGELLVDMASSPVDVLGVDFRVPLSEASARVDHSRVLQGNLDPAILFAPPEVIAAETRKVIEQGRQAPGHVFNLGHGVMPDTNPDMLALVIDTIRSSQPVAAQ